MNNFIIKAEERGYYNNLITKIFNYYNGKINRINNNAILNIEWCSKRDSTIMGVNYYPNKIVIFPKVIIDIINMIYFSESIDEKKELVKYNIWTTIIHELYHIDQIIDYQSSSLIYDYMMTIEDAVAIQTSLFARSNINDLKLFEIKDFSKNDKLDDYINNYIPQYVHYERRTYLTHILSIICGISRRQFNRIPNELYKLLYHSVYIKPRDYVFKIIYNNNEFIINNKGILKSINEINNFFNNYLIYDVYKINSTNWEIKKYMSHTEIIFKIDSEAKNIMCDIIEQ